MYALWTLLLAVILVFLTHKKPHAIPLLSLKFSTLTVPQLADIFFQTLDRISKNLCSMF